MIGLEEGLLPHSRATASDAELEEERRLCFVGMTRARRHLFISHAAQRTIRGLLERTIPSQFLRELPDEAVTVIDESEGDGRGWGDDDGGDWQWGRSLRDRERTAARGLGSAQRSAGHEHEEFPIGCLVRHSTFGLGRVESLMRQRTGTRASVAFSTAGRKTLILEYARLERVSD
jgi:DNA helicase-2/ATP-dependent DNA helicase PcrA